MTTDLDSEHSSTESASSTQTILPLPPPWSAYFSQNIHIPLPSLPSQFFNVYYTPPPSPDAPLFVFHHGAGSSALSFSLLAWELAQEIECGVLSYDARHHGLSTVTEPTDEWDLSLDTLSRDLVTVLDGVLAKTQLPSPPELLLIGHRSAPPPPRPTSPCK
jgi:protein phosphatase methylesterase 1